MFVTIVVLLALSTCALISIASSVSKIVERKPSDSAYRNMN